MEDADAIRQCLGGDSDAFRHLVRKYQARALAHARVLTGHGADAADATQDAFFDAFRNLHRFDGSREFYPWFYTLLRNRCLKQRSRKGTKSEARSFRTFPPQPVVRTRRSTCGEAYIGFRRLTGN